MEALMNISFNRQQIQNQTGVPNRPVADNPKAQAVADGVHKLLLKDVKLGDLLKVEIIDSLQKQITVMLPDGTIFEAKLDQSLDFYIGQQVAFKVKDIVGKQIHMELAVAGEQGQPEENAGVNNILKQLDIPVTKDSQEAVKLLMQKMLPVTKDGIKQIEYGMKSSQLPIDSLLSMLENEIPITPSTIRQMAAYENGEIKLQGQLEVIMDNVIASDDIETLERAHKILTSAKEQIDQIGQEPTKEVSQGVSEGQSKEVLDPNKPVTDLAKALLDATKGPVPKDFKNSTEFPLGKDVAVLKKEIATLFKENFFIDPANLKEKGEPKLEKINELYKEIYKLADQLEKLEEGLPEEQRTPLYSDVKSNIEFLTIANKYDTMLHIPLIIQDQFKHGELYIFNKKKSGKKSYNEASMLISLETISLGTVESFIKKYNNQISVQFKTDDKSIENIIKDQIKLLKVKLKDKGYDLISATYIPSTQPFSIKEEAPKDTGSGRYRFDTKA